MATKKAAPKKKGSGSNQKNAASQLRSKRSWKMDFVRVSSQPSEIRFIRLRFYKEINYGGDTTFQHPSKADIMALKKRFKNMRVHIYAALQKEMGYQMLQIRIS